MILEPTMSPANPIRSQNDFEGIYCSEYFTWTPGNDPKDAVQEFLLGRQITVDLEGEEFNGIYQPEDSLQLR